MNVVDAALPGIVLRKVTWRLVPFLCLLYVFNVLDRSNPGFARLTMQDDLKMKRATFDLCIGLFYFGYLLFEVPSNLLLRRMGARRWMARIMVTWGLVGCATMLVTGPWSFAFLRILLGVAEAGFFPGIVLYLTYWFPARERARVIALFMAASPIAGIFGNPLSGAIMQYTADAASLKGWQWLFLLEGFPSVLLGFLVLVLLTDRPEQARWLSPEERAWLVERMNQEDQHRQKRHGVNFLRTLADGRVWLLICLYFTAALTINAAGAYFPEMLSDRLPRWEKSEIGLLLALPSICAIVLMTLWGAHSDRTGERRMHLAMATFLAAGGWVLIARSESPWWCLLGMCLAQAGMMSILPIFWALPTSFLSGAAAAGGIALINSLGNGGALFGALVLGKYGPWTMVGTLCAGGILALAARHDASLDKGLPGQQT